VGPRAGLDECGQSRLPARIPSPDRPSLYRLSYRGPHVGDGTV